MWSGLKVFIAGLKLTRGGVFGLFSLLATIVLIYFSWQNSSNKKTILELEMDIKELKKDKDDLNARILDLKSANIDQDKALAMCAASAELYKHLRDSAEQRATQEATKRALEKQKHDITRLHNAKEIKELLSKQDSQCPSIDLYSSELFDAKIKALRSSGNN